MFVCLKARVKGVQIHIWLMSLPTTHEYAYFFFILIQCLIIYYLKYFMQCNSMVIYTRENYLQTQLSNSYHNLFATTDKNCLSKRVI